MKWTSVTINLSKIRRTIQNIGVIGKLLFVLSLSTLVFFLLLGIGGYVQTRMVTTSPVSSMKGLAASVSNQFFMDMVGLEVPHFNKDHRKFTFSQQNVFSFAFRFLTDINPHDPKSLIAGEVPGMAGDRTTALRTSKAVNVSEPQDFQPSTDMVTRNKSTETSFQPDPKSTQPTAAASPPRSAGKNIAFIYQSHSNESYLPELKDVKDANEAYDDKINVTLVGQRLAQNLEKDGIGTVHSTTIYPNRVKDFKYAYSYKYSLKTLQEASAGHPDLKFYFDIHRDSQERKKTTVRIDGKDYAQLYFIVGGKNPNWKANEEFANEIHEILEAKHPGISKGSYAKTERGSDGFYNQSFSPNSILIEVGGPYNTLEECYRTTDILAEAIAEVILNVQKVDSPVENKKQSQS